MDDRYQETDLIPRTAAMSALVAVNYEIKLLNHGRVETLMRSQCVTVYGLVAVPVEICLIALEMKASSGHSWLRRPAQISDASSKRPSFGENRTASVSNAGPTCCRCSKLRAFG